jgi:hypothetical protein
MILNKKKIAKIFFYACIFLLIFKILFTIIENSILNIIKSNRFHNFLINQVEYHINKYANSLDDNSERQIILQESLKKIIIKWRPFLDQLQRDIN